MPLLPGLDLARVLKMELALELQLLLLQVSPCQQPDLLRGPKPPFLLGQLAAFSLNLLVVNQRVKLQPLQGGPTTLVLLSFFFFFSIAFTFAYDGGSTGFFDRCFNGGIGMG